ncbi:hypothetical protein K493DRAFT_310687 [Basidiobolus meristosporus CBS 931.73]|uniref:Uncharacterized protein n=1 Tax=Basidiobolus meristosporus CBS 931.73 TaxID=1314790 RepID=A0A1Y1Z7J7_9FUNG|nr:hypothetical protein K493DRAFT_337846 [Basidiobolus meristosporus CBS 931.73]ORY06186.1 hypothetical protein K493DRAFT_310687 [Basidiobolus meristosporus CBS 931.73]|eukprot:ORX94354.1 hypothetical protein K493DRAFT_337846 [Basidiobolus meristosporus CBS 931.73]
MSEEQCPVFRLDAVILEKKKNNEEYPLPLTAAEKLMHAIQSFEQGKFIMSQYKQHENVANSIAGPVGALEAITDALLRDPRCFYLEGQKDLEGLQKVLMFEQQVRDCASSDIPVSELIQEYQKRLQNHGWEDVQPAIDVSIRASFLVGLLTFGVLGRAKEALAHFRRAVDIIVAANVALEPTAGDKRGPALKESFLRALRQTLMNAIMLGYATTSDKETFSLDDILAEADAILASIENDSSTNEPKDKLAFSTYLAAHARMARGFVYRERAETNGAYDLELCNKAAEEFKLAAELYPEDESDRSLAAYKAIEAALRAGDHTVGELQTLLKVASDANEKATPVFGAISSNVPAKITAEKVLSGYTSNADKRLTPLA